MGLARKPDESREFFKIGELAVLLGITTSTIRFYQKQFWPHIRPMRTDSGRYVYRRRDFLILKLIRLLLSQGLTVREARERLGDLINQHGGDPVAALADLERGIPAAPEDEASGPTQAELPLESPPARAETGVREPSGAQRTELASLRETLSKQEQELLEARRLIENQAARIQELETLNRRLARENSIRGLQIRQALREMLADLEEP